MGTWKNLGRVSRNGVRLNRTAGPQPPLQILAEGPQCGDQHHRFGP